MMYLAPAMPARPSAPELCRYHGRGFVDTGDNVLIGGFIVGPDTRTVVRAIGPSLQSSGVADAAVFAVVVVVFFDGEMPVVSGGFQCGFVPRG